MVKPLNMQQPRLLDAGMRFCNLRGLTMGTSWQVQCYVNARQSDADLRAGIQAQLDQVVAQMSPWEEDADITRFNRALANSCHVLPPEFFKVLQHSLFVAEQTGGAYDPNIGQLANLWGFGPAGKISIAPDGIAIRDVLQRGNWQQIQINKDKQSVRQTGHIQLDLCSTAKGFGVDQVARYLQQMDIDSYLIEVGGELRGLGCKPDGQPWWVTLEDVTQQEQEPSHVVALHGLSIATSGDTNRYFMYEGKRYSHTIDPRTGYPVEHGVAAVTVLHAECMIADALATAMTVMGLEAGMQYAKQLHAAARFVVREENEFRTYMSPAFVAMMDDG
jgi:thiamine biosynthesis lipoprotein